MICWDIDDGKRREGKEDTGMTTGPSDKLLRGEGRTHTNRALFTQLSFVLTKTWNNLIFFGLVSAELRLTPKSSAQLLEPLQASCWFDIKPFFLHFRHYPKYHLNISKLWGF